MQQDRRLGCSPSPSLTGRRRRQRRGGRLGRMQHLAGQLKFTSASCLGRLGCCCRTPIGQRLDGQGSDELGARALPLRGDLSVEVWVDVRLDRYADRQVAERGGVIGRARSCHRSAGRYVCASHYEHRNALTQIALAVRRLCRPIAAPLHPGWGADTKWIEGCARAAAMAVQNTYKPPADRLHDD